MIIDPINPNRNTLFFSTSGKGLWSNKSKQVKINWIEIFSYDSSGNDPFYSVCPEMDVYFDISSWDVSRDGLIYTDPKWLKDLRKFLLKNGFSKKAVNSIGYSEQGRQGKTFVNLDIDESLVEECDLFFRFALNQPFLNTNFFKIRKL